MGIVFEASQPRLGQRVAIKILRPDVLGDADTVDRFGREARLAARITSRHIVRILDVDRTEMGLPFIVMELLEGWDLASELRARGVLPIELAIGIAKQIATGVEDAHRAGVVHRDLKPSNVFLCNDDQLGAAPGAKLVKIVDFGVSKLIAQDMDLTATAATLGTPRYMAREQIRAAKNADARSDVWSMATILY